MDLVFDRSDGVIIEADSKDLETVNNWIKSEAEKGTK